MRVSWKALRVSSMPSRIGRSASSAGSDSSRPRSRLSTTSSRSPANFSRANLCAFSTSCSARRRTFCSSATARRAWSRASASCSSSACTRCARSSPAAVASPCTSASGPCGSSFCSSAMDVSLKTTVGRCPRFSPLYGGARAGFKGDCRRKVDYCINQHILYKYTDNHPRGPAPCSRTCRSATTPSSSSSISSCAPA
ncbi:hypothetical protein OF001_U40049 [Pseudomonas sp. OF001]|nr:hypothetical protein OF001_U40049 [Pseudomonas sp. OF001]